MNPIIYTNASFEAKVCLVYAKLLGGRTEPH